MVRTTRGCQELTQGLVSGRRASSSCTFLPRRHSCRRRSSCRDLINVSILNAEYGQRIQIVPIAICGVAEEEGGRWFVLRAGLEMFVLMSEMMGGNGKDKADLPTFIYTAWCVLYAWSCNAAFRLHLPEPRSGPRNKVARRHATLTSSMPDPGTNYRANNS